jgi:hypothetical protein
VVKARTWFTLFMISLGTVAATASCGSDEAIGGSGGSSGGSIIGRAGAVGRAGSSGDSSALGVPCDTDTQCGDGLICAKANGTAFGAGGPSHGMCTLACTATGTECSTLKPGAECFEFGTELAPQAYCLDACVQDTPLDLSTKCAGRPDFVCADLGSDVPQPFCVPHCRSDAECGTGLFCDQTGLLGLCVKTKPPARDPVGTPCDPEANTPTCAGYCIRTTEDGVTPVEGVCVELCAGGLDCMLKGNTPGGFCAGPLSDPFGALDLGYCLPNCSCTSDCKFPDDLCRKWADDESELASLLGADGLCYPNVTGTVELTCGEGGAGGAGGAVGAGGASEAGAGGASGEPGLGGTGGISGTGGVSGSTP